MKFLLAMAQQIFQTKVRLFLGLNAMFSKLIGYRWWLVAGGEGSPLVHHVRNRKFFSTSTSFALADKPARARDNLGEAADQGRVGVALDLEDELLCLSSEGGGLGNVAVGDMNVSFGFYLPD